MMDNVLVALIEKLETGQVMYVLWILMWIAGILFIFYLLTFKNKILGLNTRVKEISSQYKKELRNYIRAQMDDIIYMATEAAEEIIKGAESPCTGDGCTVDPLEVQLGAYSGRLECTVRGYLQDAIFGCIYENGFCEMRDTEREEYFKTTGRHLYREVKKRVGVYGRYFPNIINADKERFTEDEAVKKYRSIIMKYLRLRELEKAEIKKAECDVNIFCKLNKLRKKELD